MAQWLWLISFSQAVEIVGGNTESTMHKKLTINVIQITQTEFRL